MSYKIQLICHKYNPQKERCDEIGYWRDYPVTFASEKEANKEMQGMIRNEGHRPDAIRVRPAAAPEEKAEISTNP